MAAIEQWELDLRKQLGGVKKEKWEEDIVNEINDVSYTPKNDTNLFLIILVALGILLVVVFERKTGTISQLFNHESGSESQNVVDDTDNSENEIEKLKSQVDQLAESQTDIKSKLKWNKDRVTLMGVLLNENFVIIKSRKDPNSFIFLNDDWTLNKMPQNLEVSPSDREFLQKYVKNHNYGN
jgi:gas vesicle protein